MTLVVDVPPGREAERRYILDVVLSQWLGLPWRLRVQDRRDVRLQLEDEPLAAHQPGGITVPDVLLAPDGPGWLSTGSLPTTPLSMVDSAGGTRLPIIYGRGRTATAPGPEGVHLDVDVFGSAFFMLSRYEEAVSPERDAYGRFPAAASLAHREGFLQLPIVDAYVELLWTAITRCWPRLRRTERGYRVLLTHDVDDPLSTLGRRPLDIARQFAADLVRRRDPRLAGRRARALIGRRADHAFDPHNTFDYLLDVSESAGLRSACYFQSHERPDHPAGAHYALDHPWIRGLLRRVHERGHEVGYHAGFGTHLDPDRTATEFRRLRAAAERAGVDQQRWGGRQHYLQWTVPTTWRNWEGAGLDYDCSVAYADAPGFRTGTCHEYPTFDLTAGAPLRLRERPFQIMDVTLFGYLGLSGAAAMRAATDIADQCRRYRGTLGVLWHNDSVLRTAREQRWYAELVRAVTS
jgi:hypothetical protein